MRYVIMSCAGLLAAFHASPATAQTLAAPVKAALERCLAVSSPADALPAAASAKSAPPGLIEGQAVGAMALPDTRGQAFAYAGVNRHVQSCGIALYGPVSPGLLNEIRQLIATGKPGWKAESPDYWKATDIAPASKEYRGDPLAPGLHGVLMLTREPGPNAPTVEVQMHAMIVQ